jgi:4-hydroxy-tetrahydrodipicolinate synthase
MAASPRFGRVVTAMVTPFDNQLLVDEKSVTALVDHLASSGTDTLVVAGTTGESPTLSHDEKIRLLRLVVDASHQRMKIIAGTGSNCTADSIAFTQEVQNLGVDGVLLVAPYYNRPSQQGLYAHFKAIADAAELPVMLYNVPARTGCNLAASTTISLANDCDNIVALKEASKDLEQIAEIISGAPNGFDVYSGDDGTTLPVLAVGGAGVVSVSSHIMGRQLAQMHQAWFSGDIAAARKIHFAGLPLTQTLFLAPNPVAVKAALKLLGIIPNDLVRLPLVRVTDEERDRVTSGLKACGLL